MHKHPRTIQVTLQLPSTSLAAYEQALKLLRQKLGPCAPDFATLIQHELAHRDPRMIADDYLEAHPSHLLRKKPALRAKGGLRQSANRVDGRSGFSRPDDPSLN